MARLLTSCETYRIGTEFEVDDFIKQVKADADEKGYELSSYSRTFKQKKAKGEVIDECYVVKITKTYSSVWDEGEY